MQNRKQNNNNNKKVKRPQYITYFNDFCTCSKIYHMGAVLYIINKLKTSHDQSTHDSIQAFFFSSETGLLLRVQV